MVFGIISRRARRYDGPSILDIIPNDILIKEILVPHFNLKSILKMRRISHRSRLIIDSDELWDLLIQKDFGVRINPSRVPEGMKQKYRDMKQDGDIITIFDYRGGLTQVTLIPVNSRLTNMERISRWMESYRSPGYRNRHAILMGDILMRRKGCDTVVKLNPHDMPVPLIIDLDPHSPMILYHEFAIERVKMSYEGIDLLFTFDILPRYVVDIMGVKSHRIKISNVLSAFIDWIKSPDRSAVVDATAKQDCIEMIFNIVVREIHNLIKGLELSSAKRISIWEWSKLSIEFESELGRISTMLKDIGLDPPTTKALLPS